MLDVAAGQGIDGCCESQQEEDPVEIPEPCCVSESRNVIKDQWVHQTEKKNPVNTFKDSFEKRQMTALQEIEHRYAEKYQSDTEGPEIQHLEYIL